jgi:hypothetical protein
MLTPYAAPITALLLCPGGALAATFDAPTAIAINGRAGSHASLVTRRLAASLTALHAELGVTPAPGVPARALVFRPARTNRLRMVETHRRKN